MSRKLWFQYSLRLSLVLCLASILPIVVLYLLSEWGWIEATYDVQTSDDATDSRLSFDFLPQTDRPDAGERSDILMWPVDENEPADSREDSNYQRLPLTYDEQTGRWWIEPSSSNLVLSVPVFKLRIELPAWIAIASMPFISLLLGIAMSIWMSRRVTRPFSALSKAAQGISKQTLGVRVSSQGSQELHDLATSFNRMAANLENARTLRRQLMADVAHELRNPLSVLDGNLRALLDGIRPFNETEIAILKEQTQHLSRVVEDLREISLAESEQLPLNLDAEDVAEIIQESTRHFQLLTADKKIDLKVAISENLTHPRLDNHRVRQVLHNLLSNAVRHTPEGGRITISAHRATNPDAIQIEVFDTGEGIPPTAMKQIFDRFGGSKSGSGLGGTGLGLPIVKALVEAHGGWVEAESTGPGLGSTFRVILPFESNEAA